MFLNSAEKKSVGLIVLVSSPVSGAQQENKTLIIFKLLVFLNPRAECHSRSLGILFGKIREQWLPSRLCALFVIRGKFGLGAGGKKTMRCVLGGVVSALIGNVLLTGAA